MKKIIKVLNIFLFVLSLVLLSSCDKTKKVDFNFNDDYFIGMQEHIYEVRNLEAPINTNLVTDTVGSLGVKVFRLNVTMNSLFYVDRNDTVKFNDAQKDQFRDIVNKLKAVGVERIIYANDTFLYPYGYTATHAICVPDPYTEKDAYIRWLKVNATGYGMIAKEFPEVEYFEPINEPDYPNNEVLCRNGMTWGLVQAEYLYSQVDEANIVADLCYYMNKAIKESNPNSKMCTPAFTSLNSTPEYLENVYLAIESGAHPIGTDYPCSVDPDDYFDVIVLHPYVFTQAYYNPESPTKQGVYLVTDKYVEICENFYNICSRHGDSEKPHWYTELGYTDNGDITVREIIAEETTKQLEVIKEKLPFVECVIFYKMFNNYEFYIDQSENNFGLITAPTDPDETMEMKPIMKAIYKFMHNSSDYSEFDKVRAKYCD